MGSFKDNLGWDSLDGLFEKPFDFKKIKKSAKSFIYIHSDNDPYCPLDHAKYLHNKTGGRLIVIKGEQHFSTEAGGEKYKQFPLMLEYLKG